MNNQIRISWIVNAKSSIFVKKSDDFTVKFHFPQKL